MAGDAEQKTCQNCKSLFSIAPEDFVFYEKIQVPAPTWCWRCRAMRRMSFHNMTRLYPRICAATGKKIFTTLPPDAPMPPYSFDYWISDAWDPMDYGRDYDFSKSFFEQIRDLYFAVPWSPVWLHDRVNSEYSIIAWAKNCYLCFDSGFSEDSAYNVTLQRSKQCFDTINLKFCELCYFSINTSNSYKTLFSRNCASCVDVWFSQDCVGCTNCFGCTGLRNKSFYIFNQPYAKEEYQKKLREFNLDSWSGILRVKEQTFSHWQKFPVRYQHGYRAKGCTGDYIWNSAELRTCFFAHDVQNCAYCQSVIYSPIKDCMDTTSSGETIELCYETITSGGHSSRILFSLDCEAVTNCTYGINCRQGNNLFGCVAVNKKDHCILNKQYTKDEYNALVPKIIQHMSDMPYVDVKGRTYTFGEFFPPEISPFGFNETQGQEYFPLTRAEAVEQGYRWRDPEKKSHKITKTSAMLPDRARSVTDGILEDVIQCLHDEKSDHPWDCMSNCTGAFRITAQELLFYRYMNLPLPRLCFYCRHFERISWRNKPQLFTRRCMCGGKKSEIRDEKLGNQYANTTTHFHGEELCPNNFETSYAPNRPEIVYCEQCYQAEAA